MKADFGSWFDRWSGLLIAALLGFACYLLLAGVVAAWLEIDYWKALFLLWWWG